MNMAVPFAGVRQPEQNYDLLLRETNHRCSNDLQLVVSLLALQSRRAGDPQVRQALEDAKERVSILARARGVLQREHQPNLQAALQEVCKALHAQAEPRSILVTLDTAQEVHGLSSSQITTLALVVNELATNAIKHAFEEGAEGHIRVSISDQGTRDATVTVDDDGLPFPEPGVSCGGLGLDLMTRLMDSIGGLLIPPPAGLKVFRLRVPLAEK